MDWGRSDRRKMLFQAHWLYGAWRQLLLLLSIVVGSQVLFTSESLAFSLSPSQLTFTATAGAGAPASQTLSLSAPTSDEWFGDPEASWVKLAQTYGSFSGGSAQLSVSVNPSGMSAGIYTTTVHFWASGGQDSNVYYNAVTITLNLTTGGGGGGGGTGPSIALSPTSLSFSGTAGGSNPASKTVSLTNPGGSTLTTNWTSSDAWLVLSASTRSTTTETDTVSVTANTSGLVAGTYQATITVSGNASNSPQQIPVTLTLNQPSGGGGGSTPVLSVSPASLTFNVPAWSLDPATQYLNISNTGGGTLNWTVTDPVDWLLKDVNGATGNYALKIDVHPDYFGGAPGTYTTTVTISSSGASGSPKTIPITLNIGSTSGGGSGGGGGGGGGSTTPVLSVSPSSLTFNLPEWSLDRATQYLNISNTGGGALNWNVTDPVDWLVKSVDGGSGNGTVQIDVYPEYFGGVPGAYQTNVTISASGASGSPKTIPVTMNIGGGSGGGGGGTASVTLTWNTNGESDLQGYRVYYGTASRNYTTNTDVGKVTSYTVNGLATGAIYYFAITALDTSGNESGYSSEVSATR